MALVAPTAKTDTAPPRSDTPQTWSVLVVEDDPSLLSALESALRDAGINVVGAGTFELGRQRLRDSPPDVLVTDIRLGAYNGLQLAVMARAASAEMRVIVFSGFDDPVLRAEAERMGASYLVKPIRASDLVELIQNAN